MTAQEVKRKLAAILIASVSVAIPFLRGLPRLHAAALQRAGMLLPAYRQAGAPHNDSIKVIEGES